MAVAFVVGTGSAPMLAAHATPATYDWMQFNGDSAHSGTNNSESAISLSNVGTLISKFNVRLASPADGSPVYLSNVQTRIGPRNLLYLTTRAGQLYALDDEACVVAACLYTPWRSVLPTGG